MEVTHGKRKLEKEFLKEIRHSMQIEIHLKTT
jgi:hypothetical protein